MVSNSIRNSFSFWAHFHLPMAGENRAFRGYGRFAPAGRRVFALRANPYNRLRINKSQAVIFNISGNVLNLLLYNEDIPSGRAHIKSYLIIL
jgi:hypothetical protein